MLLLLFLLVAPLRCYSSDATGHSATCTKTGGALFAATKYGTCSAYTGIEADFDALVTGTYSSSNALAQAELFGQAVRVAFHDAAEAYVSEADLMGPDGCLSNDEENNGMVEDTSLIVSVMDPIWQTYCDQISRADFWALFAKLVIEYSDPTSTISIDYQYGRTDNTECSAGDGRLPDAQLGVTMYNQFFVTQLGLTLAEGIVLLGGHTLGHVGQESSGYGAIVAAGNTNNNINAWDTTPNVFDNEYYKSMVNNDWPNREQPNNKNPRTKNIWINKQNGNIMLNADMTAAFNIDTTTTPATCTNCGQLTQRCEGTNNGCLHPAGPYSSTYAQVQSYIGSNALFLSDFAPAFAKLVTAGYGVPTATDGATSTGKLGTLTHVDLSTCEATLAEDTSTPIHSV